MPLQEYILNPETGKLEPTSVGGVPGAVKVYEAADETEAQQYSEANPTTFVFVADE